MTTETAHLTCLLRLADTALVLGHRLSEWSSRAPTLEEDIALSNLALDQIGLARALYAHAAQLEGRGRSADDLAFLRDASEFRNVLLVEQPNGDFARTMVRQLLHSAWSVPLLAALEGSSDGVLASIAAKAQREARYHVRHAAEWVIRLGDGTEESHARTQRALGDLWMYTGELFEMDELDRAALAEGVWVDVGALRPDWSETVETVLEQATLERPADGWMIDGGRRGRHTEALGHLLAEMQFLQRAYPGASW